jgi:glycosyltransferase involved in cell wall biosynthesis
VAAGPSRRTVDAIMSGRRHVVVMVTTSYPRFAGDGVGSFIEPIAKGVAARGHEVHLVAPWHPRLARPKSEDGVFFHFYKYAPAASLNVFGYAAGLRADTDLRLAAWLAAPAAILAGSFKAWRVAQKKQASVVHAHWVIPNGLVALPAARTRPLIVSLHGSDVFVAERHGVAGRAARSVFHHAAWVTACSDDLRTRALALGLDPQRSETLPYGVDADRFVPSAERRTRLRRELDLGDAPVVFTAGRLVAKKGFEYLIAASHELRRHVPGVRVLIAGSGDLASELRRLADGTGGAVTLLGNRSQDDIAALAAAADAIAVPSIRDDAGNVDGLPNFALEALASGTPVVASRAGGLPQAIDDGRTGLLIPERDAGALAEALRVLLQDRTRASDLGRAARASVIARYGWTRVAERLETIYDQGRDRAASPPRAR